MNRRDFMKWLGRLLAALPFVALIDLESEPELTQWWGVDQAIGDSAAATIRWMPDGETIHSISPGIIPLDEYAKMMGINIIPRWQILESTSSIVDIKFEYK